MKQIMLKIIISLLVILAVSFSSCNIKKIADILLASSGNYDTRPERQEEEISNEEIVRQVDLGWAVLVENVGKVEQYLKEGYDPNKSRGEQGYRDRTPLNFVAKSFYDTYARITSGEEIPNPPPDVAILNLLVNAGADVNYRPYIWCRVNTWNNWEINYIKEKKILSRLGRPPKTQKEIEEFNNEKIIEPIYFVNDANRVIEAFLKAGADPDMRGHPYPYTLEARRARITEEEANEYHVKGTRPINEAIKKGMRWESQVDLLLQYTTLDEDSLEAAKESKDPAMIEKINKLWKEQNAR